MKKIIISIMLVFGVVGAYAETSEITTSQYYVDTNAATKQDAAPANNANSVMTYDSTSLDGIGAKAIYDATAAYGEQKSALVTAATANAAIQNGINSEFVCANPPKCNLWNLAGIFQQDNPTPHAAGKNLFNVYNIPSHPEGPGEGSMTNNGNGSITVTDVIGNSGVGTYQTLSQLAPDLVVGKTYVLSFDKLDCDNRGYDYMQLSEPARTVWVKGRRQIITQDMLDSYIVFPACYNGQTPSTSTISNIQIEESLVATAYEPYQNLYIPENQ